MELMKMISFPTNVSLTILTEKLTSQGMDGTQGNSGIGGVFVPVPHNVMENEKPQVGRNTAFTQIQSTSLAKVNGTVVTGEGITNSALLYHSD